jgi:hypothetical protein
VESFASSRCIIAGSFLGHGAPEVHTPVPFSVCQFAFLLFISIDIFYEGWGMRHRRSLDPSPFSTFDDL